MQDRQWRQTLKSLQPLEMIKALGLVLDPQHQQGPTAHKP